MALGYMQPPERLVLPQRQGKKTGTLGAKSCMVEIEVDEESTRTARRGEGSGQKHQGITGEGDPGAVDRQSFVVLLC